MRLFWKVFAVLWLATLLVGGSGFLVSRTLQQDWMLLQFHPQLRDFASELIRVYEQQGAQSAQDWLEQQLREHRLRARLFNANGDPLLAGTLWPTARQHLIAENPGQSRRNPYGRRFQLAWNSQQATYQLSLHVPTPELFRWQRTPFALLANILLAMTLLGLLSLLLSRYLTNPLRRLEQAAQSLAEGHYQPDDLLPSLKRRDEIGDLSRRFQDMATRLQTLLDSQQQLMRDISHELRSPLARLRIGLALANRKPLPAEDPLWQRLDHECSRLDALIGDILTLSRLDSHDQAAETFSLDQLVAAAVEDAAFSSPQHHITLSGESHCQLHGWPQQIASALDNLLRNALRFTPDKGQIKVSLSATASRACISVEDSGPGVPEDWLTRLGKPFVRLPDQPADSGHGLGLAIARRAVDRHQGQLYFDQSPELGGLRATISLPLAHARKKKTPPPPARGPL